MEYRTGQDVGGFGRLAQAELTKRREQRLDKEAGQRSQLMDIQLKQAQSNLQEINRKKRIRDDLGLLSQNIPEGENKFTAQYKYLMEQGAVDMAQTGMKRQSEFIDNVYSKNPEAGAKLFNDTIGAVMGTTITPVSKVPKKSELIQAKQGDKTVFMKMTPSRFEVVPMPEGVTISDLSGEAPVDPVKLDYWADQFIATGKKVFQVRGKEANRLNRLIAERAAEKQISKDISGPETAYQQKERDAIQKSIVQQEKQRGSMVSFVENLGKQIDHVKTVSDEISTFDTRLFNKPARWVKKKFAGSPELAKYEVYLGEIQSEIGKLSSGSTASVSELSEGAREKWENILDENLSIKDMIEVLEEVKEAGFIRMRSVDEGLRQSKERLRSVGKAKKTETKKDKKSKKRLKYNMETGAFE